MFMDPQGLPWGVHCASHHPHQAEEKGQDEENVVLPPYFGVFLESMYSQFNSYL